MFGHADHQHRRFRRPPPAGPISPVAGTPRHSLQIRSRNLPRRIHPPLPGEGHHIPEREYILYGLASPDDLDPSYQEFLAILAPIIDPSLASPPEVKNIVGMDDLRITIPLSRLVVVLRMEHVEYEPEQFPGLIYRGDTGTAFIFSLGKVILTGFKDQRSMAAFASGLKAKIEGIV